MRAEPHELLDHSLKLLTRHAAPALCRLANLAVDPAQIRPSHFGFWILDFGLPAGMPPSTADHPLSRVPERSRQGPQRNIAFSQMTFLCGSQRPSAPLRCRRRPNPKSKIQNPKSLAPEPAKSDLLAVAVMVGTRFFSRGVLQRVFRREMDMLKEVEFIRDLFADDFAAVRTEGRAEGRAEGSRGLLLALLQSRFGELPESVMARIEQASPSECEALAVRLLTAGSLAELGLLENGPTA